MDENRIDSPLVEKKELSGEYLFRVLKPAGCVAVLVIMVLVLIICFTHKSDPVLDYSPHQSPEYYESHPGDLVSELRAGLLPYFPGADCREEGGVVVVSAPEKYMDSLKNALSLHFGEELFKFEICE